jgi:hypothetical protein
MASLAILISWKIWKELNARKFLDTLKEEVALWILAGAKAMSNVMPRK